MNAGWTIPFIILGGALQSCGAAMNGQLKTSLVNPWLASAVSFALITLFFTSAFLIMSHPLPTTKHLASMPWWAVLVAVWSEQSRSMQALLSSRKWERHRLSASR